MNSQSAGLRVVLSVMVLLAVGAGAWSETYVTDLPPMLQKLTLEQWLGLFSTSFEQPSIMAEVARHDALIPDVSDDELCTALAELIRKYPRTADARRCLYNITGIYAQKGDRKAAEAPYRYVMEFAKRRPEGRVARIRLIDHYRDAGAPPGIDLIEECRAAIKEYRDLEEEGLARLTLAEVLVEEGRRDEALAEYPLILQRFPAEPYSQYARIRYALVLVGKGEHEQALAVTTPVLADPVWGGRAHWVHGKGCAGLGRMDDAISHYRTARQTGDGTWVRGEACFDLARLCLKEGRKEEALEALQGCLLLSPCRNERWEILADLGNTLYALGRYGEAAETAIGIKAEVVNDKGRFHKELAERAMRSAEELLRRAEEALRGKVGAGGRPATR